MRVETLCNTNWQHQVIKNEKGTLPVDMRRSKTTLLGVSSVAETIVRLLLFCGVFIIQCLFNHLYLVIW